DHQSQCRGDRRLRPRQVEDRERKLQRPEKPRLRTRTQFRAWRVLSGHDARRPQRPRLRLAYGSRPSRTTVAQGQRGDGKANELLRLPRNHDEIRRLPCLVRSPQGPRHLHNPTRTPQNPKNRVVTKPRATFRIAGKSSSETPDASVDVQPAGVNTRDLLQLG